jgi:hypothetical protein
VLRVGLERASRLLAPEDVLRVRDINGVIRLA